MEDYKLGLVEARFADIIWQNEPLHSRKLAELCLQQLNWKRSTTYTVLRRLCEKGIFQNQNGTVSSRMSRQDFYAIQCEKVVEESFSGSLPAFVAAFTQRKKLSPEEIAQIQQLIDDCKKEG